MTNWFFNEVSGVIGEILDNAQQRQYGAPGWFEICRGSPVPLKVRLFDYDKLNLPILFSQGWELYAKSRQIQ